VRVEGEIVLLQVGEQLIGAQHLATRARRIDQRRSISTRAHFGDLDELIVVVFAVEERLLLEYLLWG
jgi:hypothetical protein